MVLLAMEIIYEEDFNINRQALHHVSTGDSRALFVSRSILLAMPIAAQVEHVFQRFFTIYSCIFQADVKRWFSTQQGQYNFQLMHSFRKSQLTVSSDLDWVGGMPEQTFERQAWRLACYTPVGIHSKSSAQAISGSCFLAIVSEFRAAALHFQMEKSHNIFARDLPLLAQIHYFLEIDLKEKNAEAQGLLESKMRLLRECLEARLPIAIYD